MSELQPQMNMNTNLAIGFEQADQSEQNSFMQNVLSRSRKMLALGGSVLALGGVTASSEAATVSRPDFPPITQVIDGAEPQWEGDALAEQAFASDCKDMGKSAFAGETHFSRKLNHRRNILTANFFLGPFQECNGYGRVTRQLRIDTKDKGQKKYVRGTTYTIKDHRAFVIRNGRFMNGNKLMKIGQSCKKNHTLTAKSVQKVIYEHVDGKTYTDTFVDIARPVKCR